MPRSPTEIATTIGVALLILGLAGSAGAWWPPAHTPHIQTAHMTIPGAADRQYSFKFSAERVDSFAWSSVFGQAPDGQIGDLEGIRLAQAVSFANALSKREGHEVCYKLAKCGEEPADESYACESIEPEELSCAGYRLPTERELEILERTDRRTRFVQWTHEGQLVDARGVKSAHDDPSALAGFMLVRTVAYEDR